MVVHLLQQCWKSLKLKRRTHDLKKNYLPTEFNYSSSYFLLSYYVVVVSIAKSIILKLLTSYLFW